MQMNQLQSLVLLCQEKNISKCSEMLHISQQGLSRQIKALEQELGITLFFRTTKGVDLTPECELLLPGFKKTVDIYNQTLHKLADYQEKKQQTIRIAVCPGIKQLLGLNFFRTFQQKNPDINLVLEFHSDVECEEVLYHGIVDAAFLDWPEHMEDYDSYLILKSPLVAVMRKDHILSNKKPLSMRDLSGMNVYIPDESHRMSQRFKQNWSDFYNSLIIDFTTNEYESFYRDLPKIDGGIALTFEFLCQNLDPDLIAIPIAEKSYVELFYCLRQDHESSRALTIFSDFIYQNVDICE